MLGIVKFELSNHWSVRQVLQLCLLLVMGVALWCLLPSQAGYSPPVYSGTDTEGVLTIEIDSESEESLGVLRGPRSEPEDGSLRSGAAGKVTFAESAAVIAPGLVLLPQSGSERILLLDESGKVLHHWNIDSPRARLLPNGNLLALHGTKWGSHVEPWKDLRSVLREYSWDGDVIWEYRAQELLHHDIRVLPNGNILVLLRQYVDEETKLRMPWVSNPEASVRYDVVVEISRDGEEVWRWDGLQHLDLSFCGRTRCETLGGLKEIDWTHVNTASVLPPNKWFEAGDERFRPGNIMIMLRNWSTAMIVGRPSGKILWTYSGDYLGGLSGGHEAEMIPEGLPGAGNVLIFDNGRSRASSVVLEINPVSKAIVWKYEDGNRFFSKAAGSAQRLPNGNTLISEDVRGRVLEVDRNGSVVWEYVAPHRGARARKYSRGYTDHFRELL